MGDDTRAFIDRVFFIGGHGPIELDKCVVGIANQIYPDHHKV